MEALKVLTQESGVPLLRTSERNDFKRCPWLWDKVWNKGLRSSREPTWAWFGTAWHKGMEAYYPVGRKRGKRIDVKDAFIEHLDNEVRKVYTQGRDVDETDIVDGKELGLAMIDGYFDMYGKDSDWEVIHTEQPFQIEVTDPRDPSRVLVTYAGTWDALMWNRRTKSFWIWDHKTRKAFPSNFEFYGINDQAGSYLWVAPEILRHLGVFGKKDTIEGLVFNTARKAMPYLGDVNEDGLATNKPRKEHYIERITEAGLHIPARPTLATLETLTGQYGLKVYGDPSARQPAPLFHREMIYRTEQERVTQAERVQGEAMAMAEMRSGNLPLWKTPTEDCVRCTMFEYCSLDEADKEAGRQFANATLKRSDPYRDHRTDFADKGASLDTPVKKISKKKGQ